MTTVIGTIATEDGRATEPLKVTLKRAKETKNTVRYEEPEGGEPPIIGTLYLQKWATHRLGDPEMVTVTVDAQNSPSA
jgi:hypothetical protein